MRRRVLVVIATAVVIGAIVAFLATRPPPFDAFPPPPRPSFAPDGTRTFLIQPGTEVGFPLGQIATGDAIVCKDKGRASVPPPGTRDIDVGAIRVDAALNGDVIASCEPHPLAEI